MSGEDSEYERPQEVISVLCYRMPFMVASVRALNPVWHSRRRILTEKRMQTLVQTTATATMQTTVARTTAGVMARVQRQTQKQMQSPWSRMSGQQQMKAAVQPAGHHAKVFHHVRVCHPASGGHGHAAQPAEMAAESASGLSAGKDPWTLPYALAHPHGACCSLHLSS
jgi:hypothetical protein